MLYNHVIEFSLKVDSQSMTPSKSWEEVAPGNRRNHPQLAKIEIPRDPRLNPAAENSGPNL
jgi:hypothetical protein